MFEVLCGPSQLPLLVASTASIARAESSFEIVYEAPQECIDETAFRQLVVRQLGESHDASARVLVSLAAAGSDFRASFELKLRDGTSLHRELHAKDCAEAAPALAFVLALTLDGRDADASESKEAPFWCRWSRSVTGGGAQIFGPSQPPHDARNYGDFWGGLHNDVCQPILPPDLCARNIRLKPDCDATVRIVNDCVETIQGGDVFSRAVVGHGCAPLLDNTSCAGVVVMKWSSSDGQCPLPLD